MTQDGVRDLVGYGPDAPAVTWPGGARLAVNLVINYEEGAEYAFEHGDGRSDLGLLDIAQARLPAGVRDLAAESLFEYGSRVGVWRLFRLCESRGVPATGVEGIADGPYVFTFPAQGRGVARITFATNAAITDVGSRPLAFAGASWSVFVDPQRPDPTVRINEVMAANATGLKDEDGEEQPWIELHNFGSSAVNLDGLALADSTDGEDAWVFPPTSLAAGQYLVVFASGKDRRDPTKGRMHTSFRLARDGETVGLFNAESPRRAISRLPAEYPGQRNDIAWARMASGEWAYVRPGTPGATNGGVVVTGACADVRFSVERGYFQGGFEIMLSTPTPGARMNTAESGSSKPSTSSDRSNESTWRP